MTLNEAAAILGDEEAEREARVIKVEVERAIDYLQRARRFAKMGDTEAARRNIAEAYDVIKDRL